MNFDQFLLECCVVVLLSFDKKFNLHPRSQEHPAFMSTDRVNRK